VIILNAICAQIEIALKSPRKPKLRSKYQRRTKIALEISAQI